MPELRQPKSQMQAAAGRNGAGPAPGTSRREQGATLLSNSLKLEMIGSQPGLR